MSEDNAAEPIMSQDDHVLHTRLGQHAAAMSPKVSQYNHSYARRSGAFINSNYSYLGWRYEEDGAELIAFLESIGYSVVPTPSMLKNDNASLALRISENYASLKAQMDAMEDRLTASLNKRAVATGNLVDRVNRIVSTQADINLEIERKYDELHTRIETDYNQINDRIDDLSSDLHSDIALLRDHVETDATDQQQEPNPTPAYPQTTSDFTFRPERGYLFTNSGSVVDLETIGRNGMHDQEPFCWRVFKLGEHTLAHLGYTSFVYLQPGSDEYSITIPAGTPVTFLTPPLKS